MATTDTNSHFPEWIMREARENSASLNVASLEFLEKVAELYPNFGATYIIALPQADLEAVSTYDFDQLQSIYPDRYPILVILRSEYEQFYFIICYQVRELSISFAKSLTDGDFYASAILARSVLEICSCAHYTLRRLQSKFVEISKVAMNLARTKSPSHIAAGRKDLLKKMYEAFEYLHRANRPSNFPWADHLERFGVKINEDSFEKALHTNDCIKDISKASKLPIENCYSILSEFVHPNFGSKTLLVGSRQPINEAMDRLKIGSVSREEKCLWFIDHLSESLYYTVSLALTFHQRGGILYNVICNTEEMARTKLH